MDHKIGTRNQQATRSARKNSTRKLHRFAGAISVLPEKKKRDEKANPVIKLPNLSNDLVYSILLRLPISSLLRFRFVSKEWNEIIESRNFNMDLMEMMLSRKENLVTGVLYPLPNFNMNLMKMMRSRKENLVSGVLYPLPNFTPDRSLVTSIKFRCQQGMVHQDFLHLKLPVLANNIPNDVWMSTYSFDGLLCLIYERRQTYLNRHEAWIVIWNPCTGRYKRVSWPSDVLDRYYGVCTIVGWGYDRTISDYKIVVVSSGQACPERGLIKLRALRSDAWTTVDAPATPCNIVRGYDILEPVGLEEDVYWIGTNRDDKSLIILKFSIAEQKLTTVFFPRMETKRNFLVKLGNFNGSLYAYVYGFYDDVDSEPVEIWKYSKDKYDLKT